MVAGIPKSEGTYLFRYMKCKRVVYEVRFFIPCEDTAVAFKAPPSTTHHLSIDEIEEDLK